jgi:hypothetical protein
VITLFVMLCSKTAILSCSSENGTKSSDLLIDDGVVIGPNHGNRVQPVYSIGNCTGTAVSHNSLLYAAHCTPDIIEKNGRIGKRVCIHRDVANPDMDITGTCAEAVYNHPD